MSHTNSTTFTPGLVYKIGTSHSSHRRKGSNLCRKALIAATKEHQRYAKAHDLYAISLTLTYTDSSHFSSKHISQFLNPMRSTMYRLGLKFCYIWRLERKPGGVLHYHLMFWLKRGSIITKGNLAERWPHGCTQIEMTRSPLSWSKYISKKSEPMSTLPYGARSYGTGGFDEAGKKAVRRALWPVWLKKIVPLTEYATRVKDCGWINTRTGKVLESPYIWTKKGIVLKKSICTPLQQRSNID